jgi:hypothetical protein
MSAIGQDPALNSVLSKVGLKAAAPVSIGTNIIASTWASDYAELYVVDAEALSAGAMPEFLRQLDAVVAKRLRERRDAGKSIDAHVCIMITKALIKANDLTKESDASRYVSRKYWIDRDYPIEEILRRLTLTWVDVDAMSQGAIPFFPQEFSDLRERIAKRMGAGAANDFLEAQPE